MAQQNNLKYGHESNPKSFDATMYLIGASLMPIVDGTSVTSVFASPITFYSPRKDSQFNDHIKNSKTVTNELVEQSHEKRTMGEKLALKLEASQEGTHAESGQYKEKHKSRFGKVFYRVCEKIALQLEASEVRLHRHSSSGAIR